MKIEFCLLLFSLCACIPTTAQKDTVNKLLFESKTRGSSLTLEINSQEVIFDKNGSKTSYKTTSEEWEHLLLVTALISLHKIDDMKAPTNKRASDGAMHSKIIIETTNKTYSSQTFDDLHPPKPLMELMKYLIQLDEDYHHGGEHFFD